MHARARWGALRCTLASLRPLSARTDLHALLLPMQDVRMAVWAINEVLLPDIQYPKPQSTPSTTPTPAPTSTPTPKPTVITGVDIRVGQDDSQLQPGTGSITGTPSGSSVGGSGGVSVASTPAPAATNAAAGAQAQTMLASLLAAAAAALLL